MSSEMSNSNKPGWLVMFYIAADDVSRNGTNTRSIAGECERLLHNLKKCNNEMHLVALFDNKYPQGPCSQIWMKRFEDKEFSERTENVIENTPLVGFFKGHPGQREVDTGDFLLLQTFIEWAMQDFQTTYRLTLEEFQKIPKMLAIVTHGCGWMVNREAYGPQYKESGGSGNPTPNKMGLCPDLTSETGILTVDLRKALEGELSHRKDSNFNPKLDVLFLDACLMGTVEIIYEVKDCVNYLIAGQDYLYAEFPYDKYLDENVYPDILAKKIVEKYNDGGFQNAWAITAINVNNIKILTDAIKELALALMSAVKYDDKSEPAFCIRRRVKAAYAMSQKVNSDVEGDIKIYNENYVDLFDFVYNLGEQLYLAAQTPQYKDGTSIHSYLKEVIKWAFYIAHLIGEKQRKFFVVDEVGELHFRETIRRLESAIIPDEYRPAPWPIPEENRIIMQSRAQSTSGLNSSSLDHAYGISIYLPLGEDDFLVRSYRDKSEERGLKFARDIPEWGELLAMLCNKEPNLLLDIKDEFRQIRQKKEARDSSLVDTLSE